MDEPSRHPGRDRHPALDQALTTAAAARLGRARLRRDHHRVADGLWLPRDADLGLGSRSVALSVLYPGSVLSGWSAAVLHGFSPRGDPTPELCIGKEARRRKGLAVRRYEAPDHAVTVVRGVRVTTVPWTAFDLARFNTFDDAVLALEHLYRQGVDPRSLAKLLVRVAGCWGSQKARRALEASDPRSESPMETLTRLRLDAEGIVGFEPQVRVPELGYRLDLADRSSRVAVEYDGEHHRSAQQQTRDAQRLNRLTAAGWVVITVTYAVLADRPQELVAQIRTAQSRRRAA